MPVFDRGQYGFEEKLYMPHEYAGRWGLSVRLNLAEERGGLCLRYTLRMPKIAGLMLRP